MRAWVAAAWLGIVLSGCGSDSSDTPGTGPVTLLDPFNAYAWHLLPPESAFADRFGIRSDAHIGAETAWAQTLGEGVVIAVLDDYFDPEHPDIKANVIATYNARNGTSDVTLPPGAYGHGQLCAGMAAASANAIGAVGVAPKAKLILIGSAYESDADSIRALEYARAQGADVISCSWGSYSVSEALADEIEQIHAAGITMVFAAGNDNTDLDQEGFNDESELPWVIGVSASSETNSRASYANYGTQIDLLAPGGELIGMPTTDPQGIAGYSPNVLLVSAQYLGEDYAFFSGTSAAAPIVAGACALLKSIRPDLAPDEIRSLLIDTAEKIGDDPYDAEGFELRHAYGKINIGAAVDLLMHK